MGESTNYSDLIDIISIKFLDNDMVFYTMTEEGLEDSEDSFTSSFTDSYTIANGVLNIPGYGELLFKQISNTEFLLGEEDERYEVEDMEGYEQYEEYRGHQIHIKKYEDMEGWENYCYEDNGKYYSCDKEGDKYYDILWARYKKQ